jgi:hypothetical protein
MADLTFQGLDAASQLQLRVLTEGDAPVNAEARWQEESKCAVSWRICSFFNLHVTLGRDPHFGNGHARSVYSQMA